MGPFFALYMFGVVVPMVVSLIIFMGEGRERTRIGARIILLAPIWPLLVPVYFGRGVRWLWRTADWRGVEEEEATIREQRMGRTRGY